MSSGGTNHDNLFGNFLQAYHQNLKKLAQLFKFYVMSITAIHSS